MTTFKAFENDSQTITINAANDGGLTIENGLDSIIIYGDLTLKKDGDPAAINTLIDVLKNIQENMDKNTNLANKHKNKK